MTPHDGRPAPGPGTDAARSIADVSTFAYRTVLEGGRSGWTWLTRGAVRRHTAWVELRDGAVGAVRFRAFHGVVVIGPSVLVRAGAGLVKRAQRDRYRGCQGRRRPLGPCRHDDRSCISRAQWTLTWFPVLALTLFRTSWPGSSSFRVEVRYGPGPRIFSLPGLSCSTGGGGQTRPGPGDDGDGSARRRPRRVPAWT